MRDIEFTIMSEILLSIGIFLIVLYILYKLSSECDDKFHIPSEYRVDTVSFSSDIPHIFDDYPNLNKEKGGIYTMRNRLRRYVPTKHNSFSD